MTDEPEFLGWLPAELAAHLRETVDDQWASPRWKSESPATISLYVLALILQRNDALLGESRRIRAALGKMAVLYEPVVTVEDNMGGRFPPSSDPLVVQTWLESRPIGGKERRDRMTPERLEELTRRCAEAPRD